MGNSKLWLVLILAAFLIVLAILGGAAVIYVMNQGVSIEKGTILEMPLGGTLSEVPTDDPITLLLGDRPQNLWDIRRALEGAARQDSIRGLYIEVFPLLGSWAQVEELRSLIRDFKDSGKPVHMLLASDLATEKEIYLASSGDQIYLNPTAGVLVNGLAAEITFWKRALDKLGVKPQFIQFKEYKSAESYTRTEMTPEIRSMLTSVLSDLQDRFIESVAQDRGLESAVVRDLVEEGLLSGTRAEQVGLVDRLAYRHEIREALEEEGSYEKIAIDEFLDQQPDWLGSGTTKVALVGAEGTIVSGSSESFAGLMGARSMAKRLRDLREDRTVDAVILRVQSPGGSAVGSDMIWKELTRFAEEEKPVIVSMSGVAASGGYYIAIGGDRIVGQPSTITGSIGVIFGKFDLSGLYNWLGVDIDRIKLAPNSDIFSATTELTEAQREQLTAWIGEVYEDFVTKAADSRGMSYDELEEKARGRIYTGKQALEAGLIDELGGLSTAVAQVREVLDLEEDAEIRLELYPKPKTLWQILSSGELFETRTRILEALRSQLQLLERPSAWLLAPDLEIH